ncbi:unnamed protein product [Urochloa humidicola]
MKMAMAAASFMLCALFFAGGGTHAEATTEAVTTSEQVPSTLPVCKTGGSGGIFFDVQFCVEALGSNGRSANARHQLPRLRRHRRRPPHGQRHHHGGQDRRPAAAPACGSATAPQRAASGRARRCTYGGVVRRPQKSGCAATVRGRRSSEATRCTSVVLCCTF